MDSSYGASAPVKPPGEEGETPHTEKESVDEENAGAGGILVSKHELPEGTKEGDTCTFRVLKDFGDEVSLEYVEEGAGEKPTETTSAEDDFRAMDTEKA